MTEKKDVLCPKCNQGSTMRVQRNGFLQTSVLSHFGIYPWKCGACGSLFLFRRRGFRSRRSKMMAETGATDPNQNPQA